LRSSKPSKPQALSSFRFPSRLYPIVDTLGDPQRSHVALAEAVLAAGAPLIQLRVKDEPTRRFVELAREVRERTRRHGAMLIVNDRVDIAKLVDADGVHLGQDDLPPALARRILGDGKIVGFSTHNLLQAQRAQAEGAADYLGFGPVFSTTSKENPDPIVGIEGLREVRRCVGLPLIAIGGINATTVATVLNAGADAVALIGAIAGAHDPGAATAQLLQLCASA